MNTWSLLLTRMSEMREIAQQRLQGAEPEDFVEQVGLQLLPLRLVERHPGSGRNLVDHGGHGRPPLFGRQPRELFQVHPLHQVAVDIRFELCRNSGFPWAYESKLSLVTAPWRPRLGQEQ